MKGATVKFLCDQTVGYDADGSQIKCRRPGRFNPLLKFTLCVKHLKFHIDRLRGISELSPEESGYEPELSLYNYGTCTEDEIESEPVIARSR